MIVSYFITNFMPIMILLALLAVMYVNRDVKIPATSLFMTNIFILVVLTVISTLNDNWDISGLSPENAKVIVKLHTITSTFSYVLRPCLILNEILIILNEKKYKLLCVIPALINAIVFLPTIFGSKLAFFIGDDNGWYAGPLRPTIFISQLIYMVILLCISIVSFSKNNKRKSVVLILMFVQAALVAFFEYNAVDPSYTDAITALCLLEYYIYLSITYRQALKDKLDDYVNEVEAAGFRLNTLTKEVIGAFADSIDAKDKYTHGHSSRVAEYSRRLAEMNGKSKEECDEIYYAGLLHDIGKIGIPESIITKEGKLTPEEYDTIKQHPVLGAKILGNITAFPYLSVGALGHHERYDGKGYPNGLKGTEIPEMARIISVADAYDAMSSIRSYRDPIPQQKVREEIVKGTGTQFDPEYARLMLHLIDEDLEYKMSEREEKGVLSENTELNIDEYRSVVSEGILITPFMTTISLSVTSTEEATGIFPAPSMILFDSLDGRFHTDEKEVRDLNYFEYGEIMHDMQAKAGGVRKIETRVKKCKSTEIKNNGDYKIEAVRIKDHVLINIYGKTRTAEIIAALPDSTRYIFIGLTGEHCCYRNISIDKAEKESPEGFIPRIAEEISYINVPAGDIPNVQVDGYRTAHSKGIPIKDGLQISFHAKCLPTARLVWHCPFIDIFCSDDGVVNGTSYRDLAFMRFDGEFWECDPNCSAKLNVTKTESFEGWDAWKQYNQEGFDATVKFKVEENEITVITENAGILLHNTAIVKDIDKDIYACITGDQVAITNIHIS